MYPFNASACISPKESSLLNKPNAGLLRCNTPRNDVTNLVPYYLKALEPSKKCAFTLAEVLITLGIIGVVVAMTLPALIQNYKDKVLINQAKKSYSNFSNVLNLMKAQTEVTDYAGIFATGESSAQIAQNIAKYYNGSKVCLSAGSTCGSIYNVKLKTAVNNGSGGIATEGFGYPRINNADGSSIYVRDLSPSSCVRRTITVNQKDENGFFTGETAQATESRCATIVLDVNGQDKRPNQYGADVHQIVVFVDRISPNDNNFGSLRTIFLRNKLDYENYSDNKTFPR